MRQQQHRAIDLASEAAETRGDELSNLGAPEFVAAEGVRGGVDDHQPRPSALRLGNEGVPERPEFAFAVATERHQDVVVADPRDDVQASQVAEIDTGRPIDAALSSEQLGFVVLAEQANRRAQS